MTPSEELRANALMAEIQFQRDWMAMRAAAFAGDLAVAKAELEELTKDAGERNNA